MPLKLGVTTIRLARLRPSFSVSRNEQSAATRADRLIRRLPARIASSTRPPAQPAGLTSAGSSTRPRSLKR